MCAGESSMSEAAVRRRSAMACAYKKGLSVEPGWRRASTPSTSAAWLEQARRTDPGQHLAAGVVEHHDGAVLARCGPASSRRCCDSVCTAKRCKRRTQRGGDARSGAARPPAARASARARSAAPCLRSRPRRGACRAPLASSAERIAIGGGGRGCAAACRCISRSTPQAPGAPLAHGWRWGARTSAAVMAASRSFRPCGRLAEQGAAERVDADQLAAKRHQVEVGLQNLVLAPAPVQHLRPPPPGRLSAPRCARRPLAQVGAAGRVDAGRRAAW